MGMENLKMKGLVLPHEVQYIKVTFNITPLPIRHCINAITNIIIKRKLINYNT
jgi:hypothetical protein